MRVRGTSTKIHSLPTPGSASQKRHSRWAEPRTQASLSLSAASQWAGFLQRAQHQHLPSWLQLPVAEAKVQARTAERWGPHSYAQPPTSGAETSLSTVLLGRLGSGVPLPWFKRLPCHRERQAKKNRGRCPSPEASIPKQSATQKSTQPSPAPELAVTHNFALGWRWREQTGICRVPDLFLKELTLFVTDCGEWGV